VVTGGRKKPGNGRLFSSLYFLPGGYGGHSAGDGLVNGDAPLFRWPTSMSIEGFASNRYPLEFATFALREDSGGQEVPRRLRTQYRFRALSEFVISSWAIAQDHRPFGISGGRTGRAEHRPARPSGARKSPSDANRKLEKPKS